MGDWWVIIMIVLMLVGSIIYRDVQNDKAFRKAHNKNKKKKFHI